MVPSPASATSTTTSGASNCASATVSPSSLIGERGPPTPSTSPTSIDAGQSIAPARSAVVNGGRPSSPCGHGRSPREREGAAGRADRVGFLTGGGGEQLTVGGVAGIARLHRLAGRDVHPADPELTRHCRGPPGLAHLGRGAGDEHERARPRRVHGNSSASAVASASTWSTVWSAESATRRRDVPGGTVGGRMAVTRKPRAASASAASSAALLAAAHVRDDR